MSTSPKVNLDDLAFALEDHAPGHAWYLDLRTGEILSLFEDMDEDDLPESAEEIEESEHFIFIDPLPSHEGWNDMADFAATVAEAGFRERLGDAIAGKGAFGRFKHVLHDRPAERERWFAFQRERLHERAREWLRQHGVDAAATSATGPRAMGPPAKGASDAPKGEREELIALIEPCGEELPRALAAAILARGQELVPALIELMEDPELAKDDSRGYGYLPVHAAWLLAKLPAYEAIGPMVRLLARSDREDLIFSELVHQLKEFGPPVLETALAERANAGTSGAREVIEGVLAGLGVRDERILSALLARFDASPIVGAGLLEEYGDPAALPRLSAALDAFTVDRSGSALANDAILGVEAAIDALGGTLSEAQLQKVESVVALVAEQLRASPSEEGTPARRSRNPERRMKKAARKAKKKAQRRNRR
jgi:hypothetical protein